MAEKVDTMLVSAHCEGLGLGKFHSGQYGCHAQRSTVDAVGVIGAAGNHKGTSQPPSHVQPAYKDAELSYTPQYITYQHEIYLREARCDRRERYNLGS